MKTLKDKNKCMVNGNIMPINVYTEEDLKQAIKDLKDNTIATNWGVAVLIEDLDKIFGVWEE